MTTARHAWGLALVLGLAHCLAPMAFGATPTPEAVQLVTLDLSLLDEPVTVATLDGGTIIYTRYLVEGSIDLMITPRVIDPETGEVEVRVQELAPSKLEGVRRQREVLKDDGTFLVVAGNETFVPVANILLEMRLRLETAMLSPSSPGSCLGSSDPGMRPIDDGCCVSCGGGMVCGCIVYTSCGNCCSCGFTC